MFLVVVLFVVVGGCFIVLVEFFFVCCCCFSFSFFFFFFFLGGGCFLLKVHCLLLLLDLFLELQHSILSASPLTPLHEGERKKRENAMHSQSKVTPRGKLTLRTRELHVKSIYVYVKVSWLATHYDFQNSCNNRAQILNNFRQIFIELT